MSIKAWEPSFCCPFCGSKTLCWQQDAETNLYQYGCAECDALGPSDVTYEGAKIAWGQRSAPEIAA